METQMLHELDIVHEQLLAELTLEGHVSLELTRQNLGQINEKSGGKNAV